MSQRGVVIRLLGERGRDGVSAHELTYQYGITRSAAIVHELRHPTDGSVPMNIQTIDEGPGKLARYVLAPGPVGPMMAVVLPQPRDEQMAFEPPTPIEVHFPCGCVRNADGIGWKSRCDKHGGH